MASEETVLNFMRCPGCRSYVPASATRCRMCGATLTPEQANADAPPPPTEPVEESERRSSRIRTKTMTVSESALQSVKASLQSRPAPEPAPAAPTERSPGFRIGERREEPAPQASTPPLARPFGGGSQQSAAPSATRPDPAYSERLSVTARALRELEDEKGEDEEKLNDDLPIEAEPTSWPQAEEDDWSDVEGDEDDGEEPRVSSAPSSSPAMPVAAGEAASGEVRKRKRKRKRKKGGQGTASEQTLGQIGGASLMAAEPASARNDHPTQLPSSQSAVPHSSAHQQSARSGGSRRVKEVADGALVGWFVSFSEESAGIATEIRAGRFFICGEKLKDSDLVLADKSLSTPHCLVKATSTDGLRLQDLMSENGTYLRRRDEREYRKQNETVTVHHGDWLKFGEYEVLVCLIAYPYEDQK